MTPKSIWRGFVSEHHPLSTQCCDVSDASELRTPLVPAACDHLCVVRASADAPGSRWWDVALGVSKLGRGGPSTTAGLRLPTCSSAEVLDLLVQSGDFGFELEDAADADEGHAFTSHRRHSLYLTDVVAAVAALPSVGPGRCVRTSVRTSGVSVRGTTGESTGA